MKYEYKCSNRKCSRPAELVQKSVGRNWNGVQVTSKEPIKVCPACDSEVKLQME